MLRSQDISIVKSSLEDLSKKSDDIRLKKYEPTLSQLDKIYQDVYQFAKDNKMVIYGGWAQNYLIKKKNPSDVFYNEEAFLNDIEFYSPTPIECGMKLAKYLYKKGYPYIQLAEGVHEETYKLFVNFHNFCDISYIPKNVYDNMPKYSIDGFIFTHPHFMTIDAFRVYADPMFSFWRLEKTFSRFNVLLKHYPLFDKKLVKTNLNLNQIDENVFKFLKQEFIHNKDLIVIHHYAYNYFIKKTPRNKDLVVNIPYLSVISVNYKKDIKNITKTLEKKYPGKIKLKEFYPFFQFLGRKTEFYLDNKLIFVVYAHNDRCTVYQANFSENKKTLFGTFSLVRLMFMCEFSNQKIHNNKKDSDMYFDLLQNLSQARIEFLDEKELNVMDESPFQEFTFECLGEAIDPIRHARLKVVEKIKQKKKIKFNYDPDMKFDAKVPDYKFDNSSGNPITNIKEMTLRN